MFALLNGKELISKPLKLISKMQKSSFVGQIVTLLNFNESNFELFDFRSFVILACYSKTFKIWTI